jgi:hypothetical protein
VAMMDAGFQDAASAEMNAVIDWEQEGAVER